MHIQIRTSLRTTAFTDDFEPPIGGSVAYRSGSLGDLLGLLAEDRGPTDPPFSLGAASGSAIELGGTFSFWVHPRDGVDDDHHDALDKALVRVREEYEESDTYEVWFRMLNDQAGTLKDFVDHVTGSDQHVMEISVGVRTREGVPVQIFTARTN